MKVSDWENILLLLDQEIESPAHPVGNPAYWREIRQEIEDTFIGPVTGDEWADNYEDGTALYGHHAEV